MSPRKFEIDEITSHLIDRKNICPLMTTCSFLDVPPKVDFDAIRYAITHCGGSFEECPIFIMQRKKRSLKKEEKWSVDEDPP